MERRGGKEERGTSAAAAAVQARRDFFNWVLLFFFFLSFCPYILNEFLFWLWQKKIRLEDKKKSNKGDREWEDESKIYFFCLHKHWCNHRGQRERGTGKVAQSALACFAGWYVHCTYVLEQVSQVEIRKVNKIKATKAKKTSHVFFLFSLFLRMPSALYCSMGSSGNNKKLGIFIRIEEIIIVYSRGIYVIAATTAQQQQLLRSTASKRRLLSQIISERSDHLLWSTEEEENGTDPVNWLTNCVSSQGNYISPK